MLMSLMNIIKAFQLIGSLYQAMVSGRRPNFLGIFRRVNKIYQISFDAEEKLLMNLAILRQKNTKERTKNLLMERLNYITK